MVIRNITKNMFFAGCVLFAAPFASVSQAQADGLYKFSGCDGFPISGGYVPGTIVSPKNSDDRFEVFMTAKQVDASICSDTRRETVEAPYAFSIMDSRRPLRDALRAAEEADTSGSNTSPLSPGNVKAFKVSHGDATLISIRPDTLSLKEVLAELSVEQLEKMRTRIKKGQRFYFVREVVRLSNARGHIDLKRATDDAAKHGITAKIEGLVAGADADFVTDRQVRLTFNRSINVCYKGDRIPLLRVEAAITAAQARKASYRDRDQDGFLGGNTCAIARDIGSRTKADCNDTDKNVHPAQNAYFAKARAGGSFDYNCDGKADAKHTEKGKCSSLTFSVRAYPEGWVNAVPDCGKTGTWLKDCERDSIFSGARPITESRKQTCR